MLLEVMRCYRRARALIEAAPTSDDGPGTGGAELTLGDFLAKERFSQYFISHFMTPVVSAVWSCDPTTALAYPARYLFTVLGHHGPDAPVMTRLRPEAFEVRIGVNGLIGLGESSMAGDWEASELAGVLEVFAASVGTLIPAPLQKLRTLYLPRTPRQERNEEQNTRGNISRPYDLSNELFSNFLDTTMRCSSALFPLSNGALDSVPWDALAEAQQAKIDRLLDKAGVGSGTRLLEIGTGWGELALRAAARHATVYSVTLSSEQRDLAQERIAAAGYAGQVTVAMQDYRAVEGEFDAVVSVEMIEAVGYEYWPRVGRWPSRPSPCRMAACWPRATPTPGCTSTSSPAGSCPR